jgi:hypothetical protein
MERNGGDGAGAVAGSWRSTMRPPRARREGARMRDGEVQAVAFGAGDDR